MKKLILLSTLLFTYLAHAQNVAGTTELEEVDFKKYKTEIFTFVEKPAVFPKGTDVFRQIIAKKFKVRNVKGQGVETCNITFVVERNGDLTEIQAFGSNRSFNSEAIRTVSKIKEKWIPGEINGYKVRYRFKFPLSLKFD